VSKDLALTVEGAPAIKLGETRYPLVMTVAGMKEFAEYRDQTFEELMEKGWKGGELSFKDQGVLLGIAFSGGERRRAMFDTAGIRPLPEDLIPKVMELVHPTELLTLLVSIWNEPPVPTPDPPAASHSASPGE
jgi:hypothetical protein